MLKKTVKYDDFEGNQVEEDLYFFISTSEMTDMELSIPGGWSGKLERLTAKDATGKEIMDTFKELILKAYGEKSESVTGKTIFLKKKNGIPLSDEFEQSLAYNALYTELMMDPEKAAAFINGIWPKEVIDEANKQIANGKVSELPSGNN